MTADHYDLRSQPTHGESKIPPKRERERRGITIMSARKTSVIITTVLGMSGVMIREGPMPASVPSAHSLR